MHTAEEGEEEEERVVALSVDTQIAPEDRHQKSMSSTNAGSG